MKIFQFLESYPITLRIVERKGLQTDNDGCQYNTFTVELSYEGRSMQVPWMQGTGILNDPTVEDVLESLALEASGADLDFEYWCREYGYNDDSRKDHELYEKVRAQVENLKQLIDDPEAFQILLNDPMLWD